MSILIPARKIISRRKLITGGAASIAAPFIIRRAHAFSHGKVTPPPQAVIDGFTNLLFRAQFLNFNDFDLTDANSPSVNANWFCKHRWPNYGSGNPTRSWRTFNPQDPAQISIFPTGFFSGLTPIDSNISIVSAAQSDTNPAGYVGNAFGPGGYIRSQSQAVNGGLTVIADWMMPLPVLLGQTKIYAELDNRENFGTSNCHNAIILADETPATTDPSDFNTINLVQYPNDDQQMHYYDVSWKTMAQNGGVGKFTFLRDNIVNNTYMYIASDQLAECDVMKYVIFYSGYVMAIRLFEYYGTPGQVLTRPT